ncbi:uncharacterized protein C8A04DRAFT_26993 [Dichotomopilus funicola]|uniref:Zn(2)-C6 fungal-type domain-containing protein n=1 Tax=Dichotomopilus funicola TaxID=1934379 RepID=A0AAN6V7Z9_9PEZI|nr:hypothetical protein C8A04DRAFT_26993 [Dichotomopilus funicola]
MRACFNCAKSKLRCDWPDDTEAAATVTNKPVCIRCSRLNLRCWVTEPAKRGPRPGSRRITKVDRVSQLEQKLESLVSLLATNGVGLPGSLSVASAETPPEAPVPAAHLAPDSGPAPGPAPSAGDTSPKGAPMILFRGIDPDPHHHSVRRSPSPCELPSPQELPTFTDHVLSHEAAEHILQEYRQKFVPKFPFVPLPASWLSHQLSPHQQFLFSTIAYAVAPPPHLDRSAFHRWFRQYLGQEMVQKEQQSLELLQAILVFAAW